MIISASVRCDLPAYFSEWFFHRLKEGYVYVRNPYYPTLVQKYMLNHDVVDGFMFCTKNPKPMLNKLNQLDYPSIFHVTITPYDKEIEPYVPDYHEVIKSCQLLSNQLGKQSLVWRYDPIFINEKYTIEKHLTYFEEMASLLEGYTKECIISFIDLYEKTKRNFPKVQEVSYENQVYLVSKLSQIASKYGMTLKTCAEDKSLAAYGADLSGCFNQQMLEGVIGKPLNVPKQKLERTNCTCIPTRDIGSYNCCPHGCLYCYANEDKGKVKRLFQQHDPLSPLLIGYLNENDEIKEAKQKSYIDKVQQLSLF